MSTILYRQWTWDLNIQQGGSAESGVKTTAWDSDSSTAILTVSTDASGDISQQVITQEIITITTAQVLTTDTKTPHVISCALYGLIPLSLGINFINQRNDTFYMESNPYITESTKATVAAYTGFTVNHATDSIDITSAHTIYELYDYLQNEAYDSPQKSYPDGVITTSDGITYISNYDIDMSLGEFDGDSKSLYSDITFSGGSATDTTIIGDLTINSGSITSFNNITVNGDLHVNISSNTTLNLSNVNVTGNISNDTTAYTLTINLSNGSSITASDPGTGVGQTNIINNVSVKIIVKDAVSKSLLQDARVYIETTTGTLLTNTLTDSNGEVSFNYNYLGDVSIVGRVRRSSSSPLYKTNNITGTISNTGFEYTVLLIRDE